MYFHTPFSLIFPVQNCSESVTLLGADALFFIQYYITITPREGYRVYDNLLSNLLESYQKETVLIYLILIFQ